MLLFSNKTHIERQHISTIFSQNCCSETACVKLTYGAPFVKILYLTDVAQKVLSLRIYSYLCTDLIISAQR